VSHTQSAGLILLGAVLFAWGLVNIIRNRRNRGGRR